MKKDKTIYFSDLFNILNVFDPSLRQSTNPWFNLIVDFLLPIRYLLCLLVAFIAGTYIISCFGFLYLGADFAEDGSFNFISWLIIIINTSIVLSLIIARIMDFNEELKQFKHKNHV